MIIIGRMQAQRCRKCGAVMLGGETTGEGRPSPHGAHAGGGGGRVCEHGTSWRNDCQGTPIPPVCCDNLMNDTETTA